MLFVVGGGVVLVVVDATTTAFGATVADEESVVSVSYCDALLERVASATL